MKLIIYGLLAALTIFSTQVMALPNLDDIDVSDGVDIRAFEIGDDGDVGTLFYVVDRTTNNCFIIARDSRPGGIALVDCESLKSIPMIKTYMDTGEVGEKSNSTTKSNAN